MSFRSSEKDFFEAFPYSHVRTLSYIWEYRLASILGIRSSNGTLDFLVASISPSDRLRKCLPLLGRNKWYKMTNLKQSLRDKHMPKHGRSKSFNRMDACHYSPSHPPLGECTLSLQPSKPDSPALSHSCLDPRPTTAGSWPSKSSNPPQFLLFAAAISASS